MATDQFKKLKLSVGNNDMSQLVEQWRDETDAHHYCACKKCDNSRDMLATGFDKEGTYVLPICTGCAVKYMNKNVWFNSAVLIALRP